MFGGNAMKYKEGDRVRIRSKEWIDAQEKDEDGDISDCGARAFVRNMFQYAGREAVIIKAVNDFSYEIDIDPGSSYWTVQMFDPGYTPADKTLSPKDAIWAMLEGEALLLETEGRECLWDSAHGYFTVMLNSVEALRTLDNFNGLRRRPVKRKRAMNRWEMLDWAGSGASRGWVVRSSPYGDWRLPQHFKYEPGTAYYQRARLLPDLSGVDEDTIQGFEVEE
jgi:hypothetical protein